MSKKPFFTIYWKKANLNVSLYPDDWHGHVLIDHMDEMKSKQGVVEEALKDCLARDDVLQWTDDPPNEFFIQYKCPHFEPFNNYLRVVIRVLDKEKAKVVTAYPVKDMPKEGLKL